MTMEGAVKGTSIAAGCGARKTSASIKTMVLLVSHCMTR